MTNKPAAFAFIAYILFNPWSGKVCLWLVVESFSFQNSRKKKRRQCWKPEPWHFWKNCHLASMRTICGVQFKVFLWLCLSLPTASFYFSPNLWQQMTKTMLRMPKLLHHVRQTVFLGKMSLQQAKKIRWILKEPKQEKKNRHQYGNFRNKVISKKKNHSAKLGFSE